MMVIMIGINHRKSARIVGEVGKFHPHGDSAITNQGQNGTELFNEFKAIRWTRNFGSWMRSTAAMRYTEIRLGKVASTLLDDIDKETVNFRKL